MKISSSVILTALALTLTASGVADASYSPPGTPTQREVLRDWYCGRCVSEYAREAADCFEFWEGVPEMQLRCLTGPREEFLRCLSVCGWTPTIYEQLLDLYYGGLLDSWTLVQALEELQ